MHRSRRTLCCLPLAFLTLLLAFLAGSSALHAQVMTPPQASAPNYAGCHEMNRLLHWPRFPLHVYFSPGLLQSPERLNQILDGFDEWVTATQGVVNYFVVSKAAEADLTVTLSSQIDLPKSARALGQTTLTADGTVMTKADIQLVERADNPAQFQEICAHEFGHALGIDGHSDDADDMMFPVLSHSLLQVGNPELDWLRTPGTVTERDVRTLALAYPALVFTPKKH